MENQKLVKVELTYVGRQNKISKKTGKPYISLGIKTKEYGEEWINGFGGKENQYWAQGDIVDIEIYEDEWNGKKTLKFNTPKVDPNIEISAIKTRLDNVESRLTRIEKGTAMPENFPFNPQAK
jgi:hypothetical protein